MTGMNRELGARAPKKRQTNLIKKEVRTADVGKRIAALVVMLAVLAAAGGYGFLRWQTVSDLSRQTERLEDELAGIKTISAAYDEMTADYIRYSTDYETAAEGRLQDSRLLIDKARERIEPYGFITGITVNGNTLQVTIYSEDVSKVTDSLQNDPDGLVVSTVPLIENQQRNAEGESMSLIEVRFADREV